jgi:hypothetical protein
MLQACIKALGTNGEGDVLGTWRNGDEQTRQVWPRRPISQSKIPSRLNETGFIEDRNVTIEYRFANNAGAERLAELAADLVGRRVTSLASVGFLTRRRELVIEERPAAGRAMPKKAIAQRNDRTFFARPAGLCEAYDSVHWGGTVAPDRFNVLYYGWRKQ